MSSFLRICTLAVAFSLFLTSAALAASRTEVVLPGAAKSTAPIASGIATESMVYTSGQLGFDPATKKLAEGIEAQTRLSLEHVKAVLEAGGSGMDKTVKVLIFMKDLNQFDQMNAVYATFFPKGFPARTCVQAARIPMDALIEIEAIGVK